MFGHVTSPILQHFFLWLKVVEWFFRGCVLPKTRSDGFGQNHHKTQSHDRRTLQMVIDTFIVFPSAQCEIWWPTGRRGQIFRTSTPGCNFERSRTTCIKFHWLITITNASYLCSQSWTIRLGSVQVSVVPAQTGCFLTGPQLTKISHRWAGGLPYLGVWALQW